jgi:sec-independent protein translocase protein TatA
MSSLMFLGMGGQEIIIVALIVLLLFGGKKIPELMRGVGRGIREFNDARTKVSSEIEEGVKDNKEKKELEKHDTPSPECKCYECKDYREWLRSSELHEDELLTEFELHAELLAKQEYKKKVKEYVDDLLAEDHEEEVVEKLLAPVKNTYEERVQERHNKFYDLWEKIANEPPDEHGDAADLWNYEYNED